MNESSQKYLQIAEVYDMQLEKWFRLQKTKGNLILTIIKHNNSSQINNRSKNSLSNVTNELDERISKANVDISCIERNPNQVITIHKGGDA
jgi:hypothetical protein